MAFSSEEHLIHTESAAPAKGGRSETRIEEAAGPDHLTAVLIDFLISWFFGYLSPMALRSEEHLIHTESVAPAKAQLPEP